MVHTEIYCMPRVHNPFLYYELLCIYTICEKSHIQCKPCMQKYVAHNMRNCIIKMKTLNHRVHPGCNVE